MKVLARSSAYLKPRQVREFLIKQCPIRLFKHVDIIHDKDQGLCYCYRMPSKAKLDLSLTLPLDDCFFDYLIDHELRLNHLGEERFVVDSLRNLQLDGKRAIKEFVNGLSQDELNRFSRRLTTLQNCINNDCAPRVTQSIIKNWNTVIREPLYQSMQQVSL